jgi:hypothetical protein
MTINTNVAPGPAGEGTLVYSYRPSLLGAPWEFTLSGETLAFRVGHKAGQVDLRKISRVRLSFRPIAMQSQRFLAEIWADGAPKLEICSSSWKSMIEQERLDGPYATFIAELHQRLAQAGVPARYERGSNRLFYWPGLAIFAGLSFVLGALTAIELRAQSWDAAAIVAAFLLFSLWQAGNFFRRNRPGLYRAGALPAAVIPVQSAKS